MNHISMLARSAAALLLALATLGAQAQHRGDAHRGGDAPRWHDGAHGLNRDYPRPGWVVRQPPPRAGLVYWGGVNYRFWDGVWYTPGPRGFLVVRPPYGVVIAERPAFYSLVTIGAVAYLYANGVYYRDHPGGGYEVVPPPVDGSSGTAVPVQPAQQFASKPYVYPARAQSSAQQATDEYECHAWAVSQTGFDPTAAATGQPTSNDPAQRDNYQRARSACLEGRGYTVR
jgi:hypothetical protein